MEFSQQSWVGGMNLLVDDTRLAINEYRIGFNVRNRYDVLDGVRSSHRDPAAPTGKKQGIYTIGKYVLIFVAGKAYYRLNTMTGWQPIPNFQMSTTAERVYVVAVPITTTNYGRVAKPVTTSEGGTDTVVSADAPIMTVSFQSTATGSQSGLLVQDGVNQPQFIYIDPSTLYPTSRVTQTFDQWKFELSADLTTVITDEREYVPVGTLMEWYNGILFVLSPDGENIYRSVSGRPLDFVINIAADGDKGGDATTTSYSVGVGGITCIKAMNDGSLFVAAGNVICFSVTLNTTQGAPKIFGEYTFLRSVLFNAGCINDLSLTDILGDTGFIDLSGLRSFNSVASTQNEGRNTIFSSKVQSLFDGLIQDTTAATTFDNYALFGMKTAYGYGIVVYDTLNKDFCSLDLQQTGGSAIKQFAKIELDVLELYAVTADDNVYQLYVGPSFDEAIVRTRAVTWGDENGNQFPRMEIKPDNYRVIINNIVDDSTITGSVFVNNRLAVKAETKEITYTKPAIPYTSSPTFPDVDTQLNNLLWSVPNSAQGFKVFCLLQWTGGGSITNWSIKCQDLTPLNPPTTQANTR